jgi:hypothetical protein
MKKIILLIGLFGFVLTQSYCQNHWELRINFNEKQLVSYPDGIHDLRDVSKLGFSNNGNYFIAYEAKNDFSAHYVIEYMNSIVFKKVQETNVDHFLSEEISVTCFPNPFTESIIVKGLPKKEEEFNVEIFSANGFMVYQEVAYAGNSNLIIENLSLLNSGLYLLRINSGSFSKTLKIIKN